MYFRARYYHPGLQRFLAEDPIEFKGGINLYGYVGNNPINFIDPMGLSNQSLLQSIQELLERIEKQIKDHFDDVQEEACPKKPEKCIPRWQWMLFKAIEAMAAAELLYTGAEVMELGAGITAVSVATGQGRV